MTENAVFVERENEHHPLYGRDIFPLSFKVDLSQFRSVKYEKTTLNSLFPSLLAFRNRKAPSMGLNGNGQALTPHAYATSYDVFVLRV